MLPVVILLLAATSATIHAQSPALAFNRDIRPILSDRCFACHGPDSANRKVGLRLDQETGAKSELRAGKGDSIPIVPGSPERSTVFQRVSSTNQALRMPPAYAGHAALTAAQIETLRVWIEQGARWEKHWSFLAPERPIIPAGAGVQPIDYLVRQRLLGQQMRPSPEADPAGDAGSDGTASYAGGGGCVFAGHVCDGIREGGGPVAGVAAVCGADGDSVAGSGAVCGYQWVSVGWGAVDVAVAGLGSGCVPLQYAV
jgi:hypothetical protein